MLLTYLKQIKYILFLLGMSTLFFVVQLYIMYKLPSSNNYMCYVGGNLTYTNISFSLIQSILISIIIIGIVIQVQLKAYKNSIKLFSLSGLGAMLGTLTLFCPLCVLPLISILGVSISMHFFLEYNLLIKIISTILLLFGAYLVSSQLEGTCKICKISKNKKNS